MNNPLLAGIRILDLSRLLPGPFCTLYLAQMGAEVIKLEEPKGGDYARQLFPELFKLINRNKLSMTIDLRKSEAVEVFKRLVGEADVVIESFRPGVMEKLGCGYETLKQINPRLVYAALSGYGQTGPWKDRAGHDMNFCAYAGVIEQSGPADAPPALLNFQIADLAGGALTCALGILAGVIGAKATGIGTLIDASMLDGTLALQAVSTATVRTLGHSQPRGGDMLNGGLANYSVYECADGKHVAFAALEPKFFLNFCKAVNRPDLARLPLAPGEKGRPLREALATFFKTNTRDHWEALLGDADCCVSGIYAPEEALQLPHILARGWVSQEAESGKPLPGLPLLFSHPVAGNTPSPALGADTNTILARLGYDANGIASLRSATAI